MEVVDTLICTEALRGRIGRYEECISRVGLAVITLFSGTNSLVIYLFLKRYLFVYVNREKGQVPVF